MQVTINVPKELAEEARERGLSLEAYLEKILALQTLRTAGERNVADAGEVIDRILEMRKGNKLDGIQIKDLIHEGHKY